MFGLRYIVVSQLCISSYSYLFIYLFILISFIYFIFIYLFIFVWEGERVISAASTCMWRRYRVRNVFGCNTPFYIFLYLQILCVKLIHY